LFAAAASGREGREELGQGGACLKCAARTPPRPICSAADPLPGLLMPNAKDFGGPTSQPPLNGQAASLGRAKACAATDQHPPRLMRAARNINLARAPEVAGEERGGVRDRGRCVADGVGREEDIRRLEPGSPPGHLAVHCRARAPQPRAAPARQRKAGAGPGPTSCAGAQSTLGRPRRPLRCGSESTPCTCPAPARRRRSAPRRSRGLETT
jgi:hypothetical protein